MLPTHCLALTETDHRGSIMAIDQIDAHSAQCNIPDMVSRYTALVDQIDALPGDMEDSPVDMALWNEVHHLDAQLVSTPALTLQDMKAKVDWLKLPSNFNSGDFCGEYSNSKVLLSLFADIERIAAENSKH